ncbi:MAG: PorP/SprF family type IX secretion system membrane protein [Bacteroidales bacterium]|nr:PorP/SprF family type IX secretion system membrane protein [Bacteroidales bacterium]
MMARKLIISIYILFLTAISGIAQDVNFMMYSNTSLNVNPAIISSSDDFKVGANYRNKSYINNVNAQSAYLMLSRPLYKNNNRYGGFGFSVLSDKSGDVQQLTCEGITGAYAHEVQLTSWSRLSLGLQVAYFMKRIDTRQFSTGSQWVDGIGYDPAAGNGEEFESLTTGNFTLSSGLFWYIPNDDRTIKFYLGFAMYNLTKPKYSFFGAEQTEPFKYVANAGYEVYRKGRFSIMPQVLYYNSYYQHNLTVGSKWSYQFNVVQGNWLFSSGSIDLITDYQINEGVAVGVQVNQPGFSFGIGYGFADNFANNYTPEKGIVEISLTVKKSLFREPAKRTVVSDADYQKGKPRDFVFNKLGTTDDKKVVEKDEVKDIRKDIKRESDKEIKFKLEKDFRFGFNDAELNDEAKVYINDIVILLSENEMLNIEIIGHTDNVGTRAANQKISERRAEVVKNYLIERGIDVSRIKTRGMADKQPLFENDTRENRSKNRRVEFVIYY